MSNSNKNCSNCNAPLREGHLFCHQCGQKYRTGKPTLWFILGDFFSSLFNLDSKAFRSFFGIFTPGKLTNAFIEGKIKSFTPPIRVFIVSSVFLIASLSAFNNDSEQHSLNDEYIYQLQRSAIAQEIVELNPTLHQLFPDSSTTQIVDTIIQKITNGETDESPISFVQYTGEGGDWGFSTEDHDVPTIDIFRLSEDSLFRKHKVDGFFSTLLARQQIKNLKNGDSLEQYIISRITIQALFMMPIVALILKLLYWRRKQYFVDHFIFSLHYHSFAFILLGLLILLCHFFNVTPEILWLGLVVPLVYLYAAMKQVYKQSVGKTVLKFLLLNLSYLVAISIFAIVAIIISFLTF